MPRRFTRRLSCITTDLEVPINLTADFWFSLYVVVEAGLEPLIFPATLKTRCPADRDVLRLAESCAKLCMTHSQKPSQDVFSTSTDEPFHEQTSSFCRDTPIKKKKKFRPSVRFTHSCPTSPMNPPSTRIRKRQALQRPLPDPHQTPSGLRGY
jgi:hypothetical protein